jgi:hypothetical protein
MFTGHIFEGASNRVDFFISLPPFFAHGVNIQLSLDGAAQSADFFFFPITPPAPSHCSTKFTS